ncbi:hypothetical protein LguiA_033748 [Lonicera macranthoides]
MKRRYILGLLNFMPRLQKELIIPSLIHLLQLTTDCTVGQTALNSDFVKNSASALNLPAPEGTLLHQAPPQLSSGILRSSEQAPALVAASSNFSPLNKTFLGQNYLQNNSPCPAVRQSGGIQGLVGNLQANTGDSSVFSTPQLSTVQNLRIDDIDRALAQLSANQDGINTNSPNFACNIDEVNGVFSPTPVVVETTFVALQNHPQSPTDSTQIPPFLTTGLTAENQPTALLYGNTTQYDQCRFCQEQHAHTLNQAAKERNKTKNDHLNKAKASSHPISKPHYIAKTVINDAGHPTNPTAPSVNVSNQPTLNPTSTNANINVGTSTGFANPSTTFNVDSSDSIEPSFAFNVPPQTPNSITSLCAPTPTTQPNFIINVSPNSSDSYVLDCINIHHHISGHANKNPVALTNLPSYDPTYNITPTTLTTPIANKFSPLSGKFWGDEDQEYDQDSDTLTSSTENNGTKYKL